MLAVLEWIIERRIEGIPSSFYFASSSLPNKGATLKLKELTCYVLQHHRELYAKSIENLRNIISPVIPRMPRMKFQWIFSSIKIVWLRGKFGSMPKSSRTLSLSVSEKLLIYQSTSACMCESFCRLHSTKLISKASKTFIRTFSWGANNELVLHTRLCRHTFPASYIINFVLTGVWVSKRASASEKIKARITRWNSMIKI